MSQLFPEAKKLAGDWALGQQGASASFSMKLTLRCVGNGPAVEADRQCLRRLGLDGVAVWRAAPDGIALASERGPTIAFFSREGAGYISRPANCPSLRLTRSVTTR